jgi:hypothetical protein
MSNLLLRCNIENLLNDNNMSWEDLFAKTKLNEYEFEGIINKKLISTDNDALLKVALALSCPVADLLGLPMAISKTKQDQRNCQELLPNFRHINIDLFADSVEKVDEIISSEDKKVNIGQRVRAYMAFYELAENFTKN